MGERSSEKLARYEAILREIARKVEEQTELEAHQRRTYYKASIAMIEFGRADTYRKIVEIIQAFDQLTD